MTAALKFKGGRSRIERRSGPPRNRHAQALRVLQILSEAGETGVYREKFLTPIEHGGYGITQVSTRLFEMRKLGVVVDSFRACPDDPFVPYRLRFAPENIEQLLDSQRDAVDEHSARRGIPDSSDWYVREHGPRPSHKSQEPAADLPLFAGIPTGVGRE